jgi:hypothetical protein
VTFEWAHFPGNASQPGDRITLATPPYTALTASSAFAAATTTVSRKQDLSLAWTTDTTPAETDEFIVDVTSASVQVYCVFSAADGQGVLPATVLGSLDTGPGTYAAVSKTYASETVNDGAGPWSLGFNVSALARTTDGLASGPVTIQ